MKSFYENRASGRAVRLAFWTILGAAVILRVVKAWSMQYAPNSDYGIVALMAKHMAEGKHWVPFFYGQAYMGSLEPMISALLCRVFGTSGFMVCMGTALVSVFFLPLVYLLARDIAGPRAGLIAMAFAVVGADVNFHYASAPRGGYAMTLVLGAFSLWLAVRIARYVFKEQRAPLYLYAALGLAGGIGWWTNQLIAPFLICALLILLYALRLRSINPGTLLAGALFVLGSAPWWIWNMQNEWVSLQFGGSLGKTPAAEGLTSYLTQLARAAEISKKWSALDLLRLAAFTLLAAGLMCRLTTEYRAGRRREIIVLALAVLGLPVTLGALYITSHYATMNVSRYVLPVFFTMAVAVGVGTDTLLRRLHRVIGWFPLLIALSASAPLVAGIRSDYIKDKNQWWHADALADFAVSNGIDAMAADYKYHWKNFACNERICISGMVRERYAPYAVRLVSTERQAFIYNHQGIWQFIKSTGSRADRRHLPGLDLVHNMHPPPTDWAYLPTGAVMRATCDAGAISNAMTDWNLDTFWRDIVTETQPRETAFEFAAPVNLRGVRMFSRDNQYPWYCEVSVRGPGDKEWQVMVPPSFDSRYFWSGPRIYYDGLQFHYELRFRADHVQSARLKFSSRNRTYTVSLSEVAWMRERETAAEAVDVDAVAAFVEKRNIGHVFGPRFLTEKIHRQFGTNVTVELDPLFTRTVQQEQIKQKGWFPPIAVSNHTALICYPQDAARTATVLADRGFSMAQTNIGGLAVFTLDPSARQPEFPDLQALYWTDAGCYYGDASRLGKRRAHRLYHRLTDAPGEEELRRVLALYPSYRPALEALIEHLKQAGRTEEAETTQRIVRRQTRPQYDAPVRFDGGIRFLGYNLNAARCKRGGTFDMDYYWTCPDDTEHRALAVFVHFTGPAGTRFQDDRVFIEDRTMDIRFQPYEDIFVESRTVAVPRDIPPGEYSCLMGLYYRQEKTRCKPRTRLDAHHRAVRLPFILHVEQDMHED